jgi:catechol-2,3-dioxygenase
MGAQPRLAHVVLQTGQPEAMRDWYCKVLDAHVVHAGPGLTFMTCDDEHHRIALVALPAEIAEEKRPAAAGLHHTAFTLAGLDDLLDRYSQLAAEGITPAIPIQHGVTTSLYYRDPDRNFVELQIDNFSSPEDATAYMRGPEYAAGSVGLAFDVEAMRAARHHGGSVAELTTRAWARTAPTPSDPMTVLSGG